MDFEKFVHECKTGDIILCSGTRWYSRLIEWWLKSPISHVGIIYRDLHTAEIYLLQSELRDGAQGVRLTPIGAILDDYKMGRYRMLYLRKLDYKRNLRFHNTMKYILRVTLHTRYDDDPLDWLKIVIKHNFGNIHRTNEFICSALVAFCYIQFGFLDKNLPWSVLTPNMFSSYSKVLNFNCNLSNDIPILLKT